MTDLDGQGHAPPALTIERVSKRFGGTRALRDVSLTVQSGHIHGLLGGNGSGKSTLIKILAGVYRADEGHIHLPGLSVPAAELTPAVARHAGLRFVHQNSAVFPTLTVADNIAIGNGYPTTLGRVNRRALRRRTQELLGRYAIAARPDDLVGDLRPSDQTMVAIARALQDEDEQEQLVSVLVLDEPTAALPAQEVDMLLAALRQCAAIGQTILYVSHRIDEIREITDAVTVLRDGRLIVTRPSPGLSEADLIEHIVGRPLDRVFPTPATPPEAEVVLEVKGLRGGPLVDVSFEVRRGEIVGVAGLLGSGRTELLQMIFGSYPRDGGEVHLHGELFAPRAPKDAMDRAVALVPEDRERDAAFLDLSVRENLLAASIRDSWRGWRLSRRCERDEARTSIRTFDIKTDGDGALFSSLSGGNQQKVVLARWLRRRPSLVLLDDPTQGVDVGARADLYHWISRSAEAGMAALLVSSDFEELAQVASRVLVLRDGRITASLSGDDVDRERITELVYASEEDAA